jgi:ubiquinone/menaquinone biosynthesis C-methylase UbiE
MLKPNRKSQEPPPPIALMQLITGFWVSAAVYVAAKLKLADHLDGGPMNIEELARCVEANPEALYRLLRALASVGVFSEVESRCFSLTPAAKYLRDGVPGSLRAFSMVGREIGWEPWGHLLHSIRSGETAFNHIHGMGYFEYLGKYPDAAELFDEAMSGFVTMNGLAVAEAYDFLQFSKIIDVGGGHGALISEILKRNPQAKGVLFDSHPVVEEARKSLRGSEVEDRCECISGDFFKSVPEGGDVYILSSIIHDWNDDKSQEILRNCHRAMDKESRLLLIEMIIPGGDSPFFGKFLDLNMLVNFGGKERTEKEYRTLLSNSNFQIVRIVPTKTPSSLIEAIPIS